MLQKPQLLQLGLALLLIGVALFVIYLIESPVIAIVSLAAFSTAGVMLLRRGVPTDG